MNWELIALIMGIMLFAYWFIYLMGGPLSDDPDKVDIKAILFAIPNALAIRRLKKLGIYRPMMNELAEELAVTSDPKTRNGLILDKRRDIYLAGRDFFTWERSLLCPVCFHWWLTLIVASVLLVLDLMNARGDFFLGGFSYLVAHLIIRKII